MNATRPASDVPPTFVKPKKNDTTLTDVLKIALPIIASLAAFVFIPVEGAIALSAVIMLGTFAYYHCPIGEAPKKANPSVALVSKSRTKNSVTSSTSLAPSTGKTSLIPPNLGRIRFSPNSGMKRFSLGGSELFTPRGSASNRRQTPVFSPIPLISPAPPRPKENMPENLSTPEARQLLLPQFGGENTGSSRQRSPAPLFSPVPITRSSFHQERGGYSEINPDLLQCPSRDENSAMDPPLAQPNRKNGESTEPAAPHSDWTTPASYLKKGTGIIRSNLRSNQRRLLLSGSTPHKARKKADERSPWKAWWPNSRGTYS